MNEEKELHFEENLNREIAPEFVREIEGTKIDAESKLNLLLVAAGLKPSAIIDLTIRNGENVFLTEKDFKSVKSALLKSGLFLKIKEREKDIREDGAAVETVEILASRSEKELKELMELIESLPGPKGVEKGRYGEQKKKENKLGTMFGYPETAVEAFCEGKALDKGKLPKEVRQSEAFAFSKFSLSEDNWQKEIKLGQKYADFIKSTSPALYNQIMEENQIVFGSELK